MKIYTDAELEAAIKSFPLDLSETDNLGQIIIYTNLYRWNDGSIRDDFDPSWGDPGPYDPEVTLRHPSWDCDHDYSEGRGVCDKCGV
jgi:hypothetical protein